MFDTRKFLAEVTLGTAVADAGTLTVAYPSGTAQADFTGALALAEGSVALGNNDIFKEADEDIAITYGASNITVTNDTGATWPAGTKVTVGLIAFAPVSLRGLDSRVDTLESV